VLDDLHLVTEPATLDGLDYLLRNARPGLHLVVASRRDPLLPLYRYRLTGELTEVRADDLAFSVMESSVLLTRHGIALSEVALERLTGRTEGWAAGMHRPVATWPP
jgi:LuxR family transcriptional regulator, maltose regulon positive regulatory protein